MTDILSYSLRSTFAKEFYHSLTDPNSDDRYYMFFGRAKPWEGDVPDVEDTIKEQNEAKRNSLFYQKILPSDVSLVSPRYNWESGTIYDQYEDDVSLWSEQKKFYVLVQDVDEYKVYLCLSNNSGGQSTAVPTGESPEEIYTADGYIWKYLYTLTDEMEEFLTNDYIPVLILDKISYTDARALALDVKVNATNGMLEKITIDSYGDEFTDLVNHKFTDPEYKVTTVNSSLSFTTSIRSQMSSTTGYYNTNYIVYFENGNIGTVDTYVNNGNGTATITLCELYPDNQTIDVEDEFSIIPKVPIKGNGTGAVAVPKFDDNANLTDVELINGGENYNFAEAYFLVDTTATLSAVIPPDGGYGYDFIKEIKPTNILIKKETTFGAIPDDQEKYFGAGSYVRQLGIVKNITTNNSTNPDEQNDEYDMVLKYDGEAYGGFFGGGNYIDDLLCTFADTSGNLFELNKIYSCKTFTGEDWLGLLVGKFPIQSGGNTFGYAYKFRPLLDDIDVCNTLNIPTIFREQQSGSQILFISSEYAYDFFYDISRLDLNLLPTYFYKLHFPSFNNSSGKMYYLDPQNTQIYSGADPSTGHGQYEYTFTPNFFSINDVISLRDSLNNEILKLRVFNIVNSPFSYRTGAYNLDPNTLNFGEFAKLPQGVSGTTVVFTYISGTVPEQPFSVFSQPPAFPKWYYNETKNQQINLYETVNLENEIDLPLTNRTFFGPRVVIGEPEPDFTLQQISFANQQSAPITAPTHIMGNDTLSVATINSISADVVDNSKLNLKISTPTGDFESAVIENGEVISGESVTLLRGTPTTNFTRSFQKIGITDDLYVLSENFDVSNPANTPTTITSSVVSKLQVKRTGSTVLNNTIIPVGSYIYREPTDTVDAAAGYVISVDQSVIDGSDSTMYVYVQMEKGSFLSNDVIKCVEDPFIKDVALFSASCAGNTGITVTISQTDQRYNNIFLNKYSGEVLYIQNTTEPIQLATDTNFTTRILLGF